MVRTFPALKRRVRRGTVVKVVARIVKRNNTTLSATEFKCLVADACLELRHAGVKVTK